MSTSEGDVALAEAQARAARQRLFATLGRVQTRLSPSVLAQDAMESAADGAKRLARQGVAEVRKRPLAVAALTSAAGVLLAHRWFRKRGR